jgi:hypothetical protein
MLTGLRDLLRKHGTLSTSIIEESNSVPCASAYRLRFGSIRRAYQLIGFTPSLFAKRWRRLKNPSNDEMLEALRQLWREHGHLTRSIINSANAAPSTYSYVKRFGSILKAYELIGYRCGTGRYRAPLSVGWPNHAMQDS